MGSMGALHKYMARTSASLVRFDSLFNYWVSVVCYWLKLWVQTKHVLVYLKIWEIIMFYIMEKTGAEKSRRSLQ